MAFFGDTPTIGSAMNTSGPEQTGSAMVPGAASIGSHNMSREERLVIDFEGFAPSGSTASLPSDYAGFNWSNIYAIDYRLYDDSGYANVVQSGTASTYNGGASVGSFSSVDEDYYFDLMEGYFAAAWNNDLHLDITALRDGVEVGSASLIIDPQPVLVDFVNGTISGQGGEGSFSGDFTDIDSVVMDSYGGTSANLDGGGQHFSMDDLVVGTVGQQEQSIGGAFFESF